MWLFGLITATEMRFRRLIEQDFMDERWAQYLSETRGHLARRSCEERRHRSEDPALRVAAILGSGPDHPGDASLRAKAGFVSRRRADEVVKRLEALRNNLAHSQDIVDSDWDTILALAENLERVLDPAALAQTNDFAPRTILERCWQHERTNVPEIRERS